MQKVLEFSAHTHNQFVLLLALLHKVLARCRMSVVLHPLDSAFGEMPLSRASANLQKRISDSKKSFDSTWRDPRTKTGSKWHLCGIVQRATETWSNGQETWHELTTEM